MSMKLFGNLIEIDENGRLTIPTDGSNAGLALGSDVLLYRSAANTLTTSDSVVVGGLSVSNLTSGRIPIIGADGLLTDDSDLTFSDDTLTVTKIAGTEFTQPITFGAVPATTGTIRFTNTDRIKWRNSGNTLDLSFGVNASNQFAFEAGASYGIIFDNVTTGSSVSSPVLYLRGNYNDGNDHEIEGYIQLVSGANPYLTFYVDDDGATPSPVEIMRLYDTQLNLYAKDAIIFDNNTTGADANSPPLYLRGNAWNDPTNNEIEAILQLIENSNDPYISVKVDDDGTSPSPVEAMRIYDTYVLFNGYLRSTGGGIFDESITISDTKTLQTGNTDDDYFDIKARDNGVGRVVVARVASAADPYFSMGGSQQFKFYNSGYSLQTGTTYYGDTGVYIKSGADGYLDFVVDTGSFRFYEGDIIIDDTTTSSSVDSPRIYFRGNHWNDPTNNEIESQFYLDENSGEPRQVINVDDATFSPQTSAYFFGTKSIGSRIRFGDKNGDGAVGAGDFYLDPTAGNGMEGFVYDYSVNNRLYFYGNGAPRYISVDGGFWMGPDHPIDILSGQKWKKDDYFLFQVDKFATDGVAHGAPVGLESILSNYIRRDEVESMIEAKISQKLKELGLV